MAHPNWICACTRSPLVTPTSRMFMPAKRTMFRRRDSATAQATRHQLSSWATTSLSCQCPTTILWGIRSRARMNPYSRSPWADWFRFMKSMSICDQGSSALYCVCRWASGLVSWVSPRIHIFEGENVCIQVITPTQSGAALASRHICAMASGPFSVGFHTTRTGRRFSESR
jgi:hypothetical protein